jgi:peptidylprolyl isomerase
VVLPVVLALCLSACGDDQGGDDDSAAAFEKVQIEGEAGSEPDVTFDGRLETDSVTSDVITEGDGAEIESGDSVLAHLWVGNGYTQEKAVSTYESETPELLTVDEASLSPVFIEGVEGHTVGSRIAVLAPAEEAFGEQGNPQLGIANKDTVLVVIDLLSNVLEAPDGAEGTAPSWAPKIVEQDGAPTGFDFAGTQPSPKLRSATLIEGEGATVEKGQTIVVNYLGQVHGGKKPFDESYSKGAPTSFQIGAGKVIQGWDQTLVGASIGSRLVLAIPPALGYGKQGNEGAGIKGTDTLYFVVDVLAAG